MSIRKKILITGAKGNIGSIFFKALFDRYDLIGLDKQGGTQGIEQIDLVTDFDKLKKFLSQCDVAIHLAWDNREDFPNEVSVPENKIMAENFYKAATLAGAKRLIVASSVHANDYSQAADELIAISGNDVPDTPYGASKLYIENLGKFYAAKHGLEVICIRFGGINEKDEVRPEEDPQYDKVLLYKQDALDLLIKCIDKKNIPGGGFSNFYAVSNNKNRIHSTENNIGWEPKLP